MYNTTAKNKGIGHSWRKSIINAVILCGQSQLSNIKYQAFLNNIIAIECLVAPTSKHRDTIINAIEIFLGWTGKWENKKESLREIVSDIYDKRCDLVHQGKIHEITDKDLFYSDVFLFNILNNILRHLDIFSTKDSVQKQIEKFYAFKTLEMKPEILPSSRSFLDKEFNPIEYEGLREF